MDIHRRIFDLSLGEQAMRRRYVICGLSQRAIINFLLPLMERNANYAGGDFAAYGQIVGILDDDVSRIRMLNERMGTDFPAYEPDQFDQMMRETQPDEVIVTTPDGAHTPYIVQALQHDRPVITEKPMVITGEQARQVLDAEARSKANVRVTFNYRYTQMHIAIKRMIMEGKIGRPVNVELAWNIDSYHGSSYFYRWNRDRSASGGMSITKGCHHFDLINWWLNDVPEQVFAFGKLNYYGPHSPHRPNDADTLPIEQVKAQCPYARYWDPPFKQLTKDDHLGVLAGLAMPYQKQYLDRKPMYIYDREIDVEDTYSAVVRYRGGASLAYSANFSAPWEGYTLGINGTHGRIEAKHISSPSRCPFPADPREQIVYYPLFGERQIHDVRHVEGGHGGADPFLQHDLFVGPSAESMELGLVAGAEAGAYAVAVGEAVWRSVRERRPVEIQELLGRSPASEHSAPAVAGSKT